MYITTVEYYIIYHVCKIKTEKGHKKHFYKWSFGQEMDIKNSYSASLSAVIWGYRPYQSVCQCEMYKLCGFLTVTQISVSVCVRDWTEQSAHKQHSYTTDRRK